MQWNCRDWLLDARVLHFWPRRCDGSVTDNKSGACTTSSSHACCHCKGRPNVWRLSMCGGVKLERGAKAGSAKEKSTVTDTVRSINVTVCHCVGEVGSLLAAWPFSSPFWAIRGIEYFFRGQGVGALIGMACDESVLSLRHVTRTFVPCPILRKVNRNHVSIEGSHTQRLHFARDESGSVSPPFGLLVGWWWTHTPCDSSAAARFSVVPGLTRCERVYTCVPWTAGRTGEQLWPRFCTRVQWSVALNASTQFLEAVESLHAGRPADVIALPLDIVHFRSAALPV